MPKGFITCPICRGAGTLTENTRAYEYVTRHPITNTCLICAGKGVLPTRHVLPDGSPARELSLKLASITDKRRRAIKEDRPNQDQDISPAPAQTPAPSPLPTALSRRGIEPLPPSQDQDLAAIATSLNDALIVEPTHPAYPQVYASLRAFERARGTWDTRDEEAYIAALNVVISLLQNKILEVHNG